jgi:hypothetical protein
MVRQKADQEIQQLTTLALAAGEPVAALRCPAWADHLDQCS